MKKILQLLALIVSAAAFGADPRVGGVDVVPRSAIAAITNALVPTNIFWAYTNVAGNYASTASNAIRADILTINAASSPYFATGDLRVVTCGTLSNLFTITNTVTWLSTDVGKRVAFDGAGITNETLFSIIASVNGAVATLDDRASNSVASGRCIVWTPMETNLVNAFTNEGRTVFLPAGTYGVLNGTFYTNEVENNFQVLPALTIGANNIRIVGAGTAGSNATTLHFIGGWKRAGLYSLRSGGIVIGAHTNVTFENLIIDGGVADGYTTNHTWPASPINGDGWDLGHKAFYETAASHNVTIQDCVLRNWRGETIYHGNSAIGLWTLRGNLFENCNAYFFNPSAPHVVEGNTFRRSYGVSELNQNWTVGGVSLWQGNILTNIEANGIVFVGATSNLNARVSVVGNHFRDVRGNALGGVNAKGIKAFRNDFDVTTGGKAWSVDTVGQQGNEDWTSDVEFTFNTITATNPPTGYGGIVNGNGFIRDSRFDHNTFRGINYPLAHYGSSTNVSFARNTIDGCTFAPGTALGAVTGGPTIQFNTYLRGTPNGDSITVSYGGSLTLASGAILLPNGSAASPSLTFNGDKGFYGISSSIIGYAPAGVLAMSFDTGNIWLRNDAAMIILGSGARNRIKDAGAALITLTDSSADDNTGSVGVSNLTVYGIATGPSGANMKAAPSVFYVTNSSGIGLQLSHFTNNLAVLVVTNFYAENLSSLNLYIANLFVTNSITVSATITTTNGFASYATNATLTVGTTGITNTRPVNLIVMQFTGTSVTKKDGQGNTFTYGTLTSPGDIVLKPGGALVGTSCAGVASQEW